MPETQVRRFSSRSHSVFSLFAWRNSAVVFALCTSVLALACRDATDPDDADCDSFVTYTIGTQVTGNLATTDCLYEDDTYIDTYRFTVTTTADFQFDLTSIAFDTFLILTETDGEVLDFSGSGGPGGNARLVVNLPPGTYHILANSFAVGSTGQYIISSVSPPT